MQKDLTVSADHSLLTTNTHTLSLQLTIVFLHGSELHDLHLSAVADGKDDHFI